MQESSKRLQECLVDMYDPDWYGKDDVDSIAEVIILSAIALIPEPLYIHISNLFSFLFSGLIWTFFSFLILLPWQAYVHIVPLHACVLGHFPPPPTPPQAWTPFTFSPPFLLHSLLSTLPSIFSVKEM